MAKTSNATQQFVPVEEINNGIIRLRDGGLRAILSVFAINIALKSEEEQRSTILEFQNLLNTLEFPIQIVIQSRKYDIRPYLESLRKRLDQQKEELLQIQTREYIGFIEQFNENVNVMAKHFYVVIPYTSPALGSPSDQGIIERIGGVFNTKNKLQESAIRFEEERNQLEQRVAVIRDGLARVGLRSEQLDTAAAIEVFYKIFNPGEDQRVSPGGEV